MSSTAICSASPCTNTGTLKCTGCEIPASRYCSKDCQKRDWKAHKVRCAATQKSNCYLIRAAPVLSSNAVDSLDFAAYIEPFPLNDYGTERGEKAELNRRLGWTAIDEAGKFYDHKGSDTWYYYVYGPRSPPGASTSSVKNEAATLCCGRTVYGDVAVVRSGPADSGDYAKKFTKADLGKTLDFYRTDALRDVFAQREKSRFARRMGYNLDGVAHMSVQL